MYAAPVSCAPLVIGGVALWFVCTATQSMCLTFNICVLCWRALSYMWLSSILEFEGI